MARLGGRGRRLAPGQRVAVIDIGSNSARVVVYGMDDSGQLRIVAGTRAALRLVRDVDETRRLSAEAIGRAMDALRDFRAIALGAGAARVLGVATAAIRDAANGAQLVARVRRELGIELAVIDGEREAYYGFLGGVRGLPVNDGLLFDLGGGSVQVTHFRRRRLLRTWTLPLGSLRLSHLFLASDPPTSREIHRLKTHVRRLLEEAGISRLRKGESLVGTGGSLRNLAKIDRRARGYPISRLHGYVLPLRRVRAIASLLAGRRLAKREKVPGLSGERGDSIVGGSLAIETLMEVVKARKVHVSGQGVREGLALSLLSGALPPNQAVRAASIASLASRFWGFEAATAARRTSIAGALLDRLEPAAEGGIAEALEHAARILDIGRSVDFFDRYEHAADIVMDADLDGFSHREIALVSAILRAGREEDASLKPYRPLLLDEDGPVVRRAGVILALADDIEERCPRGRRVAVRCRVRRREVRISVPALAGWRPRAIGPRFERTFGRALVVRPGRSAARP